MHRAENARFYSAQGPVCKELENPVFEKQDTAWNQQVLWGSASGDKHVGPPSHEAGVSGREGGGRAPSCLPVLPALLQSDSPAGDGASHPSVPTGHFHTFCLLLTTKLQDNMVISPSDRSAN